MPTEHTCSHLLTSSSTCGDKVTLSYNCLHGFGTADRCWSNIEREATPEQTAHLRRDYNKVSLLHKVAHDFDATFKKDNEWLMQGWGLMQAVEEWAETQPAGYVRIVRCDDSSYMGSDLVLIEHKNKDEYMGTTVIYIPQNCVTPPAEFFLYPSHARELCKVLNLVIGSGQILATKERKHRIRMAKKLGLDKSLEELEMK